MRGECLELPTFPLHCREICAAATFPSLSSDDFIFDIDGESDVPTSDYESAIMDLVVDGMWDVEEATEQTFGWERIVDMLLANDDDDVSDSRCGPSHAMQCLSRVTKV